MASKGPKDRKNSGGHDKGTRQGRVSLAARVREFLQDGELMVQFYGKFLEGRVPKLMYDEDGEPYVAEMEGKVPGSFMEPTTDQIMLAMARLGERGYGQPAQYTHIEAEMRATVEAIAGGVNTQYIGKLTPDALRIIERTIKGLPAAPKEDATIEDAEFVEVPDDSSEEEK